jgi:hypothetical protein
MILRILKTAGLLTSLRLMSKALERYTNFRKSHSLLFKIMEITPMDVRVMMIKLYTQQKSPWKDKGLWNL